MAQQMMWDHISAVFRGQATNGTVVTVDEGAMNAALKNAGKGVYDSDWWVETLDTILDHWGIDVKHWVDDITRSPRAGYSMRPGQETSDPW